MTTELFNLNLTPAQKTALRRRAALMTAESGRQTTMSDLVRDLIDQLITAPVEVAQGNDKTKAIEFVPLLPIANALEQARFSSGKPMNEIMNEMLAEALQIEGVSL